MTTGRGSPPCSARAIIAVPRPAVDTHATKAPIRSRWNLVMLIMDFFSLAPPWDLATSAEGGFPSGSLMAIGPPTRRSPWEPPGSHAPSALRSSGTLQATKLTSERQGARWDGRCGAVAVLASARANRTAAGTGAAAGIEPACRAFGNAMVPACDASLRSKTATATPGFFDSTES